MQIKYPAQEGLTKNKRQRRGTLDSVFTDR